MNPLIAGLLGALGGVALWELVLGPAPKDVVVWCGSEDNINKIKDLLMAAGIDAVVQNKLANYSVLVKASDNKKAMSLASQANLLTYR